MLESINHNQIHGTIYAYQSYQVEAAYTSMSTQDGTTVSTLDTVSIKSESLLALTYSSDMTISGGEENRYGMLQNLVATLLQEQGIETKVAFGGSTIDIATLAPEDAQQLIADDGYFGVEMTSERIFQFAVGIAGGDPSRIDAITEGINKGFNDALEAFGGWLPEISYQTLDAVMAKLDEWVAETAIVA